MDKEALEILKAKSVYTYDDVQMLIVLCDQLIKRNEDIHEFACATIKALQDANDRLDFYRDTTIKLVYEGGDDDEEDT